MPRFDGKVALITGGGGGIGLATALAFGSEGAKVVIGDRDAERGEAAARQIEGQGGWATFLQADVADAGQVRALVDHAVETFGRLDVAFNDAGLDGPLAPLAEQVDEDFRRIMEVNARGVWLSMKYEIPAMLKSGGGSIINSSSVFGSVGLTGNGIYVASKHAIIGLTKTAALEMARAGIRVNSVSPGGIDTEMLARSFGGDPNYKASVGGQHPVGRIGRVEEVASAVTWLASDESSFVTGHDLKVDGGYTAR